MDTLDFERNDLRKEKKRDVWFNISYVLITFIFDHLSRDGKTRDLLAGGVLNVMSNCLLLGELVLGELASCWNSGVRLVGSTAEITGELNEALEFSPSVAGNLRGVTGLDLSDVACSLSDESSCSWSGSLSCSDVDIALKGLKPVKGCSALHMWWRGNSTYRVCNVLCWDWLVGCLQQSWLICLLCVYVLSAWVVKLGNGCHGIEPWMFTKTARSPWTFVIVHRPPGTVLQCLYDVNFTV